MKSPSVVYVSTRACPEFETQTSPSPSNATPSGVRISCSAVSPDP
jgi:hypothetical protein